MSSYEIVANLMELRINGETIAIAHQNDTSDPTTWYIELGKEVGFTVVNRHKANDILNWIGNQVVEPDVIRDPSEDWRAKPGTIWSSKYNKGQYRRRSDGGWEYRHRYTNEFHKMSMTGKPLPEAYPLAAVKK